MTRHAVLAPSAAHRWLACPPSVRLEQTFSETQSDYADEGTLCHKVGELICRYKLKQITKKLFQQELALHQKHRLYTETLYDTAEAYSVFVLERYQEALAKTPDAVLMLEHQVNLTDYIEAGFGTTDALIIADGVLDEIDLKYGKGVLVEATGNEQLMIYALGALRDFDFLYDLQKVRLTIYQPRMDNYDTWEISVEGLRDWAEHTLVPGARLAYEGQGEYQAGPHCQFCKAKARCRANHDYQLELAKLDFADPDLLTDQEISQVLTKAAGFKNWLTTVEEYALKQALAGKAWPGYKVVEGRSNRVYTDELLILETLTKKGFDRDQLLELIGITKLEKLVGKKQFDQLVGEYLMKPPGSPTLAKTTDARPAYRSLEAAKKDFS
jgi:hypothetical protein